MTILEGSKADHLNQDYSNMDRVGFSSVGRLVLPVYTTTERDALTEVVDGEVIYNSTVPNVQARINAAWVNLS